ncbi:hypothetical protein LCGC14_0188010 [marine sediment metagenome]|uniref:Uncharacterized protein n=1 Tax=marine sediment metagenome TaxID=412755 RepID=A0A0F9US02_9ZZZZ
MTGTVEVMAARAKLYRRAMPSRASIDYVRDNGLDSWTIAAHAGCFTVLKINVLPGNRWDFVEDDSEVAVPVAIVEAFGRDGETVLDLVAWPLDHPYRVLTMFGRADMLGLVNVYSAASYTFGTPLQMHRTPLGWWRAGCRGAVVLDPVSAARHLLDAPGRIAGQDREHSQELADLVGGLFDRSRFVASAASHLKVAA